MNQWLFCFLVSFILLILLADWKHITRNIYGGILSAFFMQVESILAAELELFKYNLVQTSMPDVFLFSNTLNIFLTGLAFNIGILIVQFQPRKMTHQLVYALVWSLFLIGFNYIIDAFGLVNYLRFKPYFVVRQFLLFLFLSWIRNNSAKEAWRRPLLR